MNNKKTIENLLDSIEDENDKMSVTIQSIGLLMEDMAYKNKFLWKIIWSLLILFTILVIILAVKIETIHELSKPINVTTEYICSYN